MLEPDLVLPSQLSDAGPGRLVPEIRLAAAVLEDAIVVLRRRADSNGRRQRDFFDTRRWLWDDDRGWPFAFRNVCELLALDAAAVRTQLESPGAPRSRGKRRRVSTFGAARSSCHAKSPGA
jgi:hypothetical protein